MGMSIMRKSKQNENTHATWVNESMGEEMDDAEVCWEIYCQEIPFDHSSMAD